MFWPFKRKEISLKEYLSQTKKLTINGVVFQIRKINLDDHLAGLDVVLQIRDIYRKEKNVPAASTIDNTKKINKIMRDIVFAGVVVPALTMKKDEPNKIHVDELMADPELASKLSQEILTFTYSKKK